MAQNITLMGASYSDVPAVELPKTGGGTATFTDTSDATATAGDILSGKTAYVDGVKLTGTGGAVESVNGQTGTVVLTASDVGASEAWTVQNMTASDTVVTLNEHYFYIFPTMTTLTVTVGNTGMYDFRFTSGTTATALTVNGATLPDGFTTEAGKVYEVNIYYGYGVVSEWSA